MVRDLSAQQLSDYAEEVAQWAVTNKLATLSTCATNDAACRQTFIKAFGRKAFRAPLTDAQVRAYDGLFAAEPSFAEGASAMIAAMLQSPNLLYRRELGTPDPAKPGQFLLDAPRGRQQPVLSADPGSARRAARAGRRRRHALDAGSSSTPRPSGC